ncbi:eukaryotic translation initiation factor 2-alpha kinase-like protein, partial [Dinothrombium tinctorium]
MLSFEKRLFYIIISILAVITTHSLVECAQTKTSSPITVFEPNLLVVTLNGSIYAIGKRSGRVKWSLSEQSLVKLPSAPNSSAELKSPLFLPDPKDGSIYRYNSIESNFRFDGKQKPRDLLEKLPFTLSELIALSPCRSKDGLLFIGKKIDSWFTVNKESGEKMVLDSDGEHCPRSPPRDYADEFISDEKLLLITKTEFQLTVIDIKRKQKIWNLTVVDYSNTANLIRAQNHYELLLLTSSKTGKIVALDAVNESGFEPKELWSLELGSPVISLYEFDDMTAFGQMIQVPFLTFSEDFVKNHDIHSIQNLYSSIYIGETGIKSLYALTTLVDLDNTPLYSLKPLPLIEGPKVENENESEDFVDSDHISYDIDVLFNGFYEYPGYSRAEIVPHLTVVPSMEFLIAQEPQTTVITFHETNNEQENKPKQCVYEKNYSQLMHSLHNEINNTCENDEIEQVVIVSLWHWWKEVLGISITLAIFLNIFVSYLKRKFQHCAKTISPLVNEDCILANCIEQSEEKPQTNTTLLESSRTNSSTSRQSSTEISYVSRFYNDFEIIQRLGKGGYGVVLECRNKIDTCHYAIKIILLPFRAEAREKVMREVKALAKLDHRGIVRFYNSWLEVPPADIEESRLRDWENSEISSFSPLSNTAIYASLLSNNNSALKVPISKDIGDKLDSLNYQCYRDSENSSSDSFIVFQHSVSQKSNKNVETECYSNTKEKPKELFNNRKMFLFIQMQLCRKDTLREWLKNNPKRDRSTIFEIFLQIASAVVYVHDMGLMHRDLKPSNIFFAVDGSIKIGDFGLVTAASVDDFFRTPEIESKDVIDGDERHTNCVGTQLYMSPEQIRGVMYSNKVDIYSLGVIFFEMIVPFNTEMERISVLRDVRQQKFPLDFAAKYPQEV